MGCPHVAHGRTGQREATTARPAGAVCHGHLFPANSAVLGLVCLTPYGTLCQLCDDLLCSGRGKAATAQERKEFLSALGEVRFAGQTGGEVGVRISSVVEGALGVETRHHFVHHLLWYPAPVQLLLDLVGRAWAGSQILQCRGLSCQEP